ncbi:MAG: ATP phosphoribosyltransferase regulatory subunit [Oscillospiraceae bacterium]|nr:ATP phosphoribosyltransferase regulatory subunit [Oscillospiraceae bacterium]
MENLDVLRYHEQVIIRLRALYRQFGYTQYETSRFEEYELYARNKAFLPSDEIITFSGVSGKLMALRPDVTLSIVKNASDGVAYKLFYNENVYRPALFGNALKERMQAGVECIGDIDLYSTAEVIVLARRSLDILGGRCSLDISHMGFISGLFESVELPSVQQDQLLRSLGEKNAPEIAALCAEFGLGQSFCDKLASLVKLYGPFDNEMLGELKSIAVGARCDEALAELTALSAILKEFGVSAHLDFSIVNDLSYYSGIIFQGYIEGAPAKVLSGGRYDKLLQKFGKKSGAIGFAVYLDMLEHEISSKETDVILPHNENSDPRELARKVNALINEGKSVRVCREAVK